jgi:succinyl-diaminopimelate desuccinylase
VNQAICRAQALRNPHGHYAPAGEGNGESMIPFADLLPAVETSRDRVVAFLRRLVQVPSRTGNEEQVAALVSRELRTLGIEDVRVDGAGNIIARLPGGPGPRVMLHAHLDIVDPGDSFRWTYPPYSGEQADDHIWGRGSVDDKGCVAAQVYALGLMREFGLFPAGDVLVASVVGEEIGGLGTRHLAAGAPPDLAIIGEPSKNTLRRGHRGRFEFVVTFRGRSAHASTPQHGRNPAYALSRFVLAMQQAPMARDSDFGDTTAVPTLLYVDQTSSNVIPAAASVHLDWRNAPGETLAQARALVESVAEACLEPQITVDVAVATRLVSSYTGLSETIEHAVTPFWIAADDPRLLAGQAALSSALGRSVPIDVWPFFTDGGFLHAAGVPCIGFGPGDPAMAHVLDERLPVSQLVEATAGYMALALCLSDPASWGGVR